MWEKNIGQKEMLRILQEEGYDIKTRDLVTVRRKNGWPLRNRHGDRAKPKDSESGSDSGSDSESENEDVSPSMHQYRKVTLPPITEVANQTTSTNVPLPGYKAKTVKVSKRQQRRGGLGLVRFPSETTLSESKKILSLDSKLYQELRSHFQKICEEEGFAKKTVSGPSKWEAAKKRLIHERPHLQSVFWISQEGIDKKLVALDVICTDVTKRMRIIDAHMSLQDAKSALGLNPVQTHQVRMAWFKLLNDGQIAAKGDTKPGQWESMKHQWVQESDHLRNLDLTGTNPESIRRTWALEFIALDVLKRRREERRKLGKTSESRLERQASVSRDDSTGLADADDGHFVPIPYESQPSTATYERSRRGPGRGTVSTRPEMADVSRSMGTFQEQQQQCRQGLRSWVNMSISANSQMGQSLYTRPNTQSEFANQPYMAQHFTGPAASTTPSSSAYSMQAAAPTSFAVFLRVHPSSTHVTNTGLWIGTMASHTVQELRQTAVAKFPGACCVRIEGILKDGKGSELMLPIEEDQELSAYLSHVESGAPTFAVQLV